MYEHGIQRDSAAWIFFTKLSFAIAISAMAIAITFLPVDPWMRAFLAVGLFFTIGAAITLSKTIRDEHEANKLINKIHEVKTEKILKEFDSGL